MPDLAAIRARCACCDERPSGAQGTIWCHRCLRRKRWEYAMSMEAAALDAQAQKEAGETCSDCPPAEYPTDKTRCDECPRRAQKEAGER